MPNMECPQNQMIPDTNGFQSTVIRRSIMDHTYTWEKKVLNQLKTKLKWNHWITLKHRKQQQFKRMQHKNSTNSGWHMHMELHH